VIAVANAIKDMGAISSVNILFSDISTDQAHALAKILKEHPTLKSLCGNKGNETELDMRGKRMKTMGPEDAIMLVPEIIDNGAMTSINLSNNHIVAETRMMMPKPGMAIGDLVDGNPITHIHSNGTDVDVMIYDGIRAIANAIPDMGALSTLIFGGDKYKKDRAWVTPAPATLKVGMTEANFSNKNLGAGGAIIISAWISHKDNGTLIKLDISSNHIGAEQEGGLQHICMASGIELAK
jgi:hypothetical protein